MVLSSHQSIAAVFCVWDVSRRKKMLLQSAKHQPPNAVLAAVCRVLECFDNLRFSNNLADRHLQPT